MFTHSPHEGVARPEHVHTAAVAVDDSWLCADLKTVYVRDFVARDCIDLAAQVSRVACDLHPVDTVS